ncbi:dTMP kinase [Candidatus Babeliales bacterium]|nr:dTMP kinase [Candidatus Babeliales bacterium]
MSSETTIKKKRHKGFLVAIEGIDGSGKSTLSARIYRDLTTQGLPIYLTREPGDTFLGQKLRAVLHQTQKQPCSHAEFLMFAADRAEHFHEVVIPQLKKGNIVISDRLADSSLAYQGFGRGLDLNMLKSINTWAMRGIEPDLVIFLDIDEDTALKRITGTRRTLTSFELEHVQFWKKVRKGFKTILEEKKDRAVIIDALKLPEHVCQDAVNAILEKCTNK